ncbi:cobalamin-binding protein [Daejeonella sp. H1SJ63]|uniref:cobalamin-binding protein n=1 Tax=Daejeonella sp. H1SJ63 TaxID=3034145 RepID=UPI0023EC1E66|nr:cobalamin-binding protein [Daejeonella sp. H1SJ63]
MPEQRIISLLPAATEIVCALGMEHQLVGRSHECDYPESVKVLPVCSSAKFLSGSDSAAIDRQVKEILSETLSIYTIDKELIRKLAPDVIITQAQCEVCAVSLSDVELALKDLLDKECRIISLSPNSLEDIYNDISYLAKQLGVEKAGAELLELAEERTDIIRHKLKFIVQKPKVVCIEWLSPLMVAGNWTPEIIDIAGGTPVLSEKAKHSPYVDFQSIREEDPDILVIMPCGFSVQRTLQEISLLLELPGWSDLKAVKDQRVYIADGNQYFNRSGPRITDSIEIMAEIINPKQFIFGYEGNGWLSFKA